MTIRKCARCWRIVISRRPWRVVIDPRGTKVSYRVVCEHCVRL